MMVTWEVEDGYVGGSRPHQVDVDDDEFAECETEEERVEVIERFVQEDFNQVVLFTWEREE